MQGWPDLSRRTFFVCAFDDFEIAFKFDWCILSLLVNLLNIVSRYSEYSLTFASGWTFAKVYPDARISGLLYLFFIYYIIINILYNYDRFFSRLNTRRIPNAGFYDICRRTSIDRKTGSPEGCGRGLFSLKNFSAIPNRKCVRSIRGKFQIVFVSERPKRSENPRFFRCIYIGQVHALHKMIL